MSTLPPEAPLTDLERDFFENEPPGLFPQNQDSYWGQVRRVLSDKLQEIADMFAVYYLNQSANTVNEDDATEWEEMLGIPAASGRTLDQRRAFWLSRLTYGAFTRTRRNKIIEFFITATFGQPVVFTPDGVPIPAGGISLFGETVGLSGTYNVIEDIPNFSYEVRIRDDIDLDFAGLERELWRITPAHLSLTIVSVPIP
jgi:hypothetical protein